MAAAGLGDWVSLDRSFSTYTWFLKEQIQQRADACGNCEPLYDFCFLDGAHFWEPDALRKRLSALGWQANVTPIEHGWYILDATRS